jgi:hypothetical protein
VTITTDSVLEAREFRGLIEAQWPFLCEPAGRVQQDLAVQEYTDPLHEPMIPHTLVLGPGRVVRTIYNGYWFWGRPSTHQPWQDLREATREARPNWDPGVTGLREAWDVGDRSPTLPIAARRRPKAPRAPPAADRSPAARRPAHGSR